MKIRIKLHRKILGDTVFLFLAILCVSTVALLEFTSISIPVFSLVKNPILYIGGLCILTQTELLIRTFMKKKYFYLWLLIFLFCGLLLLSAYNNQNPTIGTSPIRGTIRMILYLLELYALIIWVGEKGYGKFLVDFLFFYALILVIISDTLLLTKLIVFVDGNKEAYLNGTKFDIVYLHMDLLMLWVLRSDGATHTKGISKVVLIVSIIYMEIISFRVQCMTGVLGTAVLFAGLMMIDRPSRKGLNALNSPAVFILALAGCLLFPFVSELIMAIPAVRHFVVEVLGKSENLTGRMEIFKLFGEQMEGHWAFGFGMGNANVAAMTLFGYATAQNAILQWILQAGFWVTAVLALIFIVVFDQLSKTRQFRKTMPLVVLIYVYIFLGVVETTFSMSFFLWLMLLFELSHENNPQVQSTLISKE